MIPILTYHSLSSENESNKYTIAKKDFHEHLKFLYDNNYKCISVDDLLQSVVYPDSRVSEKSVVISFDDGHESDYAIALPLLKKYNFKATFFVTTDWINKPDYMNSFQLRTLNEEGMSVQSHAKTHSFLNELSVNGIYQELAQSKNDLEDILGKEISCISFPGGRYNKKVMECAKELRYSAAFCSIPFYLKEYNNVYLIGRNMIKRTSEFEKIVLINRAGKLKYKAFYICKSMLKQFLGNNIYHFLWKMYIKK